MDIDIQVIQINIDQTKSKIGLIKSKIQMQENIIKDFRREINTLNFMIGKLEEILDEFKEKEVSCINVLD
jgi:hypothetical protein